MPSSQDHTRPPSRQMAIHRPWSSSSSSSSSPLLSTSMSSPAELANGSTKGKLPNGYVAAGMNRDESKSQSGPLSSSSEAAAMRHVRGDSGGSSTSQQSTSSISPQDRAKSLSPARRRSVIACRECRNRKVRCDNNRPSCSRCQRTGANCVFEQISEEESEAVRLKRRKRAWTMSQSVRNCYLHGEASLASTSARKWGPLLPATGPERERDAGAIQVHSYSHSQGGRHAPHSSWPGSSEYHHHRVPQVQPPQQQQQQPVRPLPRINTVPTPDTSRLPPVSQPQYLHPSPLPLPLPMPPTEQLDTPLFMAFCNADMHCQLVSQECHTLLGFPPEMIQSLYDVVHPAEWTLLTRIFHDLAPRTAPLSPDSATSSSTAATAAAATRMGGGSGKGKLRQHPLSMLQPVPWTSFRRANNVRLRLRNGTYDDYSIQVYLGGGGDTSSHAAALAPPSSSPRSLSQQQQHPHPHPHTVHDHLFVVSFLKQGQSARFDHANPQRVMLLRNNPHVAIAAAAASSTTTFQNRSGETNFSARSALNLIDNVAASMSPLLPAPPPPLHSVIHPQAPQASHSSPPLPPLPPPGATTPILATSTNLSALAHGSLGGALHNGVLYSSGAGYHHLQ